MITTQEALPEKNNPKSKNSGWRTFAGIMAGSAALAIPLGYTLASCKAEHDAQELQEHSAIERVVAKDGLEVDVLDYDSGNHIAYGSVAVSECVLPEVSIKIVERDDAIADAASYSLTYVLDPQEMGSRHHEWLSGEKVTKTFTDAESLEADVLKGQPCGPLAEELAYQAQF